MTARRWPTAEAFESDIKEYMTMCADKGRLANVAGFCVWAEITRETYYAQKDYYSDTYKRNEDRWEDEALNADIAPAVKIFYMKNKCGYKDKQEIDSTVKVETSPIDELVKSIEQIKGK